MSTWSEPEQEQSDHTTSPESMSVATALVVLELSNHEIGTVTSAIVQRQYRRLALKYHPDKNGNSIESYDAFHRLVEAYDIVRIIASLSESTLDSDSDSGSESINTGYFDILTQFVKSVMATTTTGPAYMSTSVLRRKIIEIVSDYQNISVELFENIDRDTSIIIYQFLCTHRDTLYLSVDVLDRIRTTIQSKFEDLHIYTISPTLDDLFSDNVYRLKIEGHTYFVPLWHKEIYFDDECRPGKEILVLCDPQMDAAKCILDDNNNLHMSTEIAFTSALLNKLGGTDVVVPGSTKMVRISNSGLALTTTQVVCVCGVGLLRIHEKDMYNDTDRGDVFITVRFV